MRLYPTVVVQGKSFVNSKRVVVPMQSMRLQEIVRRFVRRESLPVSKEGIYNDEHDIDLEKIMDEDFTVQEEVINEMQQKVKDLDKKVKMEEAQRKDAMSKAAAKKRAELLEDLRKDAPNPQTANADKA